MKVSSLLQTALVASLLSCGESFAHDLLAGEREVSIEAIPGVIEADASWKVVWADFVTADGIVGIPDGGVLFAQEQTDTIRKLDADGREYVYVADVHGAGSVSVDNEGRVYAVERTCTEPLNEELAGCRELNRISIVHPVRRVLAHAPPSALRFRFLGRLSDIVADGRGGAYFTAVGIYHVSFDGAVSTVADEDVQSNGIMLNRQGDVLYATNSTEVLAFDVRADGSASDRRVFGSLGGDDGADGMAIDSEGRLYVTANGGIHVFAPEGDHLGHIPTPRRPITLAFSGREKRTLYVPTMGAVGPDGRPWTTPEGIRNVAMTIYTIEMSAQGFTGRPK